MRYLLALLALAAVALGAYLCVGPAADDPLCPDGKCPPPHVRPLPGPAPDPFCPDGRCPPRRPRDGAGDWQENGVVTRAVLRLGDVGARVGGPRAGDGAELQCDYPGHRHVRNTASKGAGLCVFTSAHHCADQQDIPQLADFPRWLIDRGIAGGGYPEKLKDLIARISKERNLPVPDYVQVEAPAAEVWPIVKAACASGRPVCTTYYRSPTGRYGGRWISHMVNLQHADDRNVAVLDNNYVGYEAFEWMTPEEYARAAAGTDGRIWVVVFLDAPAPMPPHNGAPAPAPRPARLDQLTLVGAGGDYTHDGYEWRPWRGQGGQPDRDYVSLFRHGVEIGVWRKSTRTYHPKREGLNYGKAEPCPTMPPDDFGVVTEKLSDRPSFRRNGLEVTSGEVLSAVERLPDDGKKRRVTFSGPREQKLRVLADWKDSPEVAAVKDAFVLKAYEPDHWHVRDYGWRQGLTVTEPGGQVLVRWGEYPGAGELAGALRRLRPDYDPARDPLGLGGLLRKKQGPSYLIPGLLLAAGGLIVLVLALRKGGK